MPANTALRQALLDLSRHLPHLHPDCHPPPPPGAPLRLYRETWRATPTAPDQYDIRIQHSGIHSRLYPYVSGAVSIGTYRVHGTHATAERTDPHRAAHLFAALNARYGEHLLIQETRRILPCPHATYDVHEPAVRVHRSTHAPPLTVTFHHGHVTLHPGRHPITSSPPAPADRRIWSAHPPEIPCIHSSPSTPSTPPNSCPACARPA